MRKRKTLILITAIMIIALCFSSCGINVQQGNTNKNNEKTESTKTEEAKEYVIPKVMIDSTGMSTKEMVDDFESDANNKYFYNSIKSNKDGTVTITATNTQRKYWVDNAKLGIKEQKEILKANGCKLLLNQSKTEANFYFDSTIKASDFIGILAAIKTSALDCQFFSGTEVEDLKYREVIINIDNGDVLSDTQLGEKANINPGDWE